MRKAFNVGLVGAAAQLGITFTVGSAAEGMSVSSGTLETDIGVGLCRCDSVSEAFTCSIKAVEPDCRASGS